MKLGKSVIIAGLLFSSVLGSVNMGAVTAMAATDNSSRTARNIETINVVYRYGNKKTERSTTSTMIYSNDTISESAVQNYKDKDYGIAPGQSFKVFKDSVSGVKTVEVKLEKLKLVHIRCIVDGNQLHDENLLVFESDTTVNLNQLDLNLNNRRIVDNKTVFDIDRDKIVHIKLESTKVLNVIYDDENGNTTKLPFGKMTVLAGRNTVSSDEVPVPTGYSILPDKKLIISENGSQSLIRVKVQSLGNNSVAKPTTPTSPNTPSTSTNQTKPGVAVTKPNQTPKPNQASMHTVSVNFINKENGNFIGYVQLTGKKGSSMKIQAPSEYEFDNEKDAFVKLDGSNFTQIKVNKITPTKLEKMGEVTTNGGSFKRLYTLEGKMIGDRALSANSAWKTDQYVTLHGEKMYRVATNEWVKAADVK